MKYNLHLCFALAFNLVIIICQGQSVLQSGEWHKFSVSTHGVYKISYEQLRKIGIDPSKVDPKYIKIYGNEGGMLPQLNSASRPQDLTELAIMVKGGEDGLFDKGDFILFYAEGPDLAKYDLDRDIFQYESNLYDTKNFYFLNVGDTPGKRIGNTPNLPGGHPLIQTYDDYVYHEIDTHNELKSGREWFGEKFDINTDLTLEWDVTGIVENTNIKVVSDVMAQSNSGSSFKLYLNNQTAGEQYVLPIPAFQYAEKGNHTRDTLVLNTTSFSLANASNLEFRYQYIKSGSGRSVGYLDFLLLSFQRKLALYSDQNIFRSAGSLQNAQSTFKISSAPTDAVIWDITNPYEPKQQEYTLSDGGASFSAETTSLKEFVVFNNRLPEPTYVDKISNQNLHNFSTPNVLIVTNAAFRSEAERLALHRQQKNGGSVIVVTAEEIFNEFSSGRQDVTAIRDFVKYLYDKNPDALKALILFGRGSYDYKDRVQNNTNFVTTYESRNSLSPLETYSSDDYFTFLENHEGNWYETNPEYHTMEIGVGRLPVKTLTEAKNIVDKIISYETSPATMSNWRKRIVFVADDGDGNLHNNQADQLSKQVETEHPEFDTKKVYLDAYQQVLQPAGEASPDANKTIVNSLDQGALIINYTGHGNEKLWAHERIFDDFIIESLENNQYPLFVTATCEFGRQDNPAQISSAELCLTRNSSGAIGLVSTARPVSSSTNFELNKAFYNVVFELENNERLSLGEIFRRTKNNSISGVSNRNFSLLGDPSMQLAMPKLHTRVTEIMGGATTDTLKALSKVTVKGEVMNENQERVSSFNGTLQAALYDKETEFTTLGNENSPFKFKQWYNAIYRGQAKVVDGEFQFEFIVPKNIAYQLGKGKLSLYASDKNQFLDASGVDLNFVVGKSELSPGNDIIPPTIQVFIGDTTFINGGITTPNTTLIVRLNDESGINLSGYGIGNNIIALLDGTESFVLNDYYESEVDDFTKGWIHFPLKELTPGQHTVTVKVWDTFNNPGEATISFTVTDGNAIVIESFGNYPNPFLSHTTLFFTHNRSGDDLEAIVSIVDVTGKELKSQQFLIEASPYQVDLVEITVDYGFGENLKAGLYLARLVVRSLTNGSKNEQVTKLIMSN